MYLLDTDVTSNLLDPRRSGAKLRERVLSVPMDDLAISIITVEEMLRGALDDVRRSQSARRDISESYSFFQRLYIDLHRFAVLPYDSDAHQVFVSFSSQVRRIGTSDCRIAAIALAADCTLVSANLRDFAKIPGLTVEDWTL